MRILLTVFFLLSTTNIHSKVGLVLSGGGAKGFAHIGVLKELDRLNIKVDYIAGTSMGCLIGALYAIGYSGKELEEFTFKQDWTGIFNDVPSRRYVPMYEKDETERYVSSFSLSSDHSFIPTGIISGQKLYMLFSELTWGYRGIRSFSELPIPVICMATDLVSGDEVIIDNGSLPRAMRASMSIPTIFTPIESGERLLVDGGVVNNLPVKEAKNMGADFIIAVDVAGGLYKKPEIRSLFEVMEQVVSLQNVKKIEAQKKLADVVIEIDTSDYSIASFDQVETLISMGTEATKPYLAKMEKLPKRHSDIVKRKPSTEFSLKSIKIEGTRKVSENFILKNLNLKIPSNVSEKEMDLAVERLYGTQFFESIMYDLNPVDNEGFELVVNVRERATSLFRFGFNYSNYSKASLLLNTTFKNILWADSRVSLDLNLSENPAFRGQYYVYSYGKPSVGFRTEILMNKFNLTKYNNNVAEIIYRFSYYALSLNAETYFSNSFLMGLGVNKEFTTRDPKVQPDKYPKSYNEFLTFRAFIEVDTLDSIFYPKSGTSIDAEFRVITDALSFQKGISHKTFEQASMNAKYVFSLGSKVALQTDVSIGASISSEPVPYEYMFYYGGFRANYKWFQPFEGLDYMSIYGPNSFVLGEAIQIEMLKNIYLIFKANIGQLANSFKDVFNIKDHYFGAGSTVGWDSPIGPVELTVMKEFKRKNWVVSFSLGYWF